MQRLFHLYIEYISKNVLLVVYREQRNCNHRVLRARQEKPKMTTIVTNFVSFSFCKKSERFSTADRNAYLYIHLILTNFRYVTVRRLTGARKRALAHSFPCLFTEMKYREGDKCFELFIDKLFAIEHRYKVEKLRKKIFFILFSLSG